MDCFADEAGLAELELALSAAQGPARAGARLALAWHLRERDTARSLALADAAAADVAAGTGVPAGRASGRIALVRSHARWLASALDEARALAEQAHDRFVEAGDEDGRCDACVLLAWVHDARGDVPARDAMLAGALAAGAAAADPARAQGARLAQAAMCGVFRDAGQAAHVAREVLAPPLGAAVPVGLQAHAEFVLGHAAKQQDRHGEALVHYGRVLELGRAAGELRLAAVAAVNLCGASITPNGHAHGSGRAEGALREEGTAARMPPEHLLSALSRDYERAGDLARALDFERRAAAARAVSHARSTAELATRLQAQHETERARTEAAHHEDLAQALAAREQAQEAASRAKSTFLAHMGHEVRSRLNAMLGFARLLQRDPRLAAGCQELAIVVRSGEHLCGLMNQVLEMSRIEAGRVTLEEAELDLHGLLDELAALFEGDLDPGVALLHERAPQVPRRVRGDGLRLRQVLSNLLANAVKFTPRGRITLRVSVPAVQRLRFEVCDTGVGIEAAALAELGQPFVQAHAGRRAPEGTGLGLAISRGLVRLMGGELRLESTPGEGTTVGFDLPLRAVAGPAAADARACDRRVPLPLARGTPPVRLLVVDEREPGRLLLRRLLEPLGFEVRCAADGAQALQAWAQWAPQLVLMDMRMPVAAGCEAARRIKATAPGRAAVVVALAASGLEAQRDEILAAGCDDFLRKPIDEAQLLQTIARHLGLHHERAGAARALAQAERPPRGSPACLGLPAALHRRLGAALQALDVQAVSQALEEVRACDPPAAERLAAWAEQFDYAAMEAWLRREASPA